MLLRLANGICQPFGLDLRFKKIGIQRCKDWMSIGYVPTLPEYAALGGCEHGLDFLEAEAPHVQEPLVFHEPGAL